MMDTTSQAGHGPPGGAGSPRRHLTMAVALLTGLAGLVHLAAAWAHRDHTTLLWMFLVAAALQVLGAVALVSRPRLRPLLVLSIVVNGAFLAFYVLTRVTGLSDVEGLEQAQPVGYGDVVAASLEAAAVAAAVVTLVPAALPATWMARLDRRGLVVLATLALVVGAPAVVASATHDGSHIHGTGDGHGHGDHAAGDDHVGGHGDDGHRHAGDGELALGHPHEDDDDMGHGDHGSGDDGHHGTGGWRGTGHGHRSGPGSGPGGGGHGPDGHGPGGHDPGGHDPGGHDPGGHDPGGHDPGGHDPGGHDPGGHDPGGDDPGGHDPGGDDPGGDDPGGHDPSFPDDWTPEQIAEAEALIADTEDALTAFTDVDAIEAMGFEWFGDLAPGGYQHWNNWDWIEDEHILDPEHPESLVFRSTPSGGLRLEAAMFILPARYTMSTIPEDVAWLPGWHDHDNLCADENRRFTGLAFDGQCYSGTLLDTPPMTHVWIVDTPCGRFAGVDEGGLQCEGHEH